MFYVLLGFLGVCIGSFLNAWTWRTHQQHVLKSKKQKTDLSITKGRSMCTHCGHQLAAKDLVPIFSWISLGGKCRYCGKKISPQYPVVEALTGLLFVFSYLAWPLYITGFAAILQFICWLILLSVLVALTIYDLRYMLLPNRLVFWAAAPVATWKLYEALIDKQNISVILSSAFGLIVFGGIFYVLFQVSDGKWIGGGDVKLGFLLGAWLADPILSLLAIFLASLIGTIIIFSISLSRPITRNMKLPFGPLLIGGFMLAFLFGNQLVDTYNHLLLQM